MNEEQLKKDKELLANRVENRFRHMPVFRCMAKYCPKSPSDIYSNCADEFVDKMIEAQKRVSEEEVRREICKDRPSSRLYEMGVQDGKKLQKKEDLELKWKMGGKEGPYLSHNSEQDGK